MKRTFLLLKVWWGNTVCLLFLKAYLSMFWIPLRFLVLYNIDSIKSIIDVWLLYLISFNKEYNKLNMVNFLNCHLLAYWCFNIAIPFIEYISISLLSDLRMDYKSGLLIYYLLTINRNDLVLSRDPIHHVIGLL